MAIGLDHDFYAFFAATHGRVVSQIYAMTGSLHEAEDCVQEAYARAWQRWATLAEQGGNPEAWVRTVATRLAVSSWRKAVNRLKAHRREQPPAEVPGMNPDHIAVIAALRKISPEIAAETGAPPGTVKARLSRGRRALAPHLTEFADSLDEQPRAAHPSQPRRRGI
jgi:RNA polymerase sigma-70 factor (ECF subfamily)